MSVFLEFILLITSIFLFKNNCQKFFQCRSALSTVNSRLNSFNQSLPSDNYLTTFASNWLCLTASLL